MRSGVEDLAPHDPVREHVIRGMEYARQEYGLVKIRRNVVLLHNPGRHM